MKHTARCIIIKICNQKNSSSNPYPISVHPIRALSTLCRVHRHFPLKEKRNLLNMLHATGCHTKYLFQSQRSLILSYFTGTYIPLDFPLVPLLTEQHREDNGQYKKQDPDGDRHAHSNQYLCVRATSSEGTEDHCKSQSKSGSDNSLLCSLYVAKSVKVRRW